MKAIWNPNVNFLLQFNKAFAQKWSWLKITSDPFLTGVGGVKIFHKRPQFLWVAFMSISVCFTPSKYNLSINWKYTKTCRIFNNHETKSWRKSPLIEWKSPGENIQWSWNKIQAILLGMSFFPMIGNEPFYEIKYSKTFSFQASI